jgi:peptidoglycan hydrolase-like protein with peptidoglycan-binding domain
MRLKFAPEGVRRVAVGKVLAKLDRVYVPLIPGMIRGTVTQKLHSPDGNKALVDLIDTALDAAETAKLQTMLVKLGYKVDVDGDYGESVKKAMREFQTAHDIDPNGTLDSPTSAALDLALDKLNA